MDAAALFQGPPESKEDSEDEEEEEEWVDVVTEEAALKNIREQFQGREKDEAQQLTFLHAIYPACLAAHQRGQDTLEPHCCKAAVVERIVDLHRVLLDILDAMLGNLLAESPGTDRFHYLLENSTEFPRMAHHMAQLALFVSDPSEDISRQAREGVYRLCQLLLHHRGLTVHEAEDPWVWDWHQDSRLLCYKNTAMVGEELLEKPLDLLWLLNQSLELKWEIQ
ncbi:hypothetical protein UY3_15904 [Chelonia mydas]|uniref:Maestro-like HEAT-repeats domain-containing protein n=1 Tax=Chelonia mydas TaxID=8469 RepID=M7AP20_CHEMY|nr:hypothetical protein UY3_15904 [Chelonia mydas]